MGDNAQLKYSYPQHFRYLHCARNESLPQEGSFQANIHQCEIFGYNQIKFNFYKSLENHNPIQKSLMEQIGSFHDLIMLWCSNQQRNVDKVAKVIQKVNAPLKSSFSSWWLGIRLSYGKICKREIGLVPISILYVVEQGRILDPSHGLFVYKINLESIFFLLVWHSGFSPIERLARVYILHQGNTYWYRQWNI